MGKLDMIGDRIGQVRRIGVTGRAVAAVGVAALVALVGCGGDDDGELSDDAAEGTTTTSGGPTTTAVEADTTVQGDTTEPGGQADSVEEEIIARYLGFWDARFDANSPPNPDDPALAEFACCEQLDNVIDETEIYQSKGLEFERPDEPLDMRWVTVTRVEANGAVIQDCWVNDGVVVHSGSGEIENDDVVTYNIRAEMRRIDGRWFLAKATRVQTWEGVTGCALAQDS